MWISQREFEKHRAEAASERREVWAALVRQARILRDQLKNIQELEHAVLTLNRRLVALEARLSGAAVEFKITQQGESMGAITGTAIGGQSVFAVAPLQADGVSAGTLQAGNIPQWSSKDANVTITPSADGTQATVALSAAETATTYDLTVSGVNSDGNAISTTFTIPVLAAVVTPPPPPPDTAATQFGLSQLS